MACADRIVRGRSAVRPAGNQLDADGQAQTSHVARLAPEEVPSKGLLNRGTPLGRRLRLVFFGEGGEGDQLSSVD